MVEIKNIESVKDDVIVTVNINGIETSVLVVNTSDVPPQNIVNFAVNEFASYLGVEVDIPTVEDEVIGIELLGLNDLTFTEGQSPIEVPIRCVGTTKFGKKLNLTAMSVFTPELPIVVNATESYTQTISVQYGEFNCEKSFNINFTSLEDIAKRETERLAFEEAEKKRLAEEELNRPKTLDEKVEEMQLVLADLISITLEV